MIYGEQWCCRTLGSPGVYWCFLIQPFTCNRFSNVKCRAVTVLVGSWDFGMDMIRAEHKLGCILGCCCTITLCFWLEGGWCFLAALFWVIRALELFWLGFFFFFFFHSCIRISHSYSDENKRENSHMLNTLSATSGLSKKSLCLGNILQRQATALFYEICI